MSSDKLHRHQITLTIFNKILDEVRVGDAGELILTMTKNNKISRQFFVICFHCSIQVDKIMSTFKKVFIVTVAVISNLAIAEKHRNYYRELDLGGGFVRKQYTVEVTAKNAFESLAHYSTVFYKDTEIGGLDDFSLSPNKTFAFYKRLERNNLGFFVFNLSLKTSSKLQNTNDCYVIKSTWSPDGSNLTIYCSKDYKSPERFKLKVNMDDFQVTKVN